MDLPEPLTPADCDLKTFPYMPLDVQRLRDSKLTTAVRPDRAFFAVILWCASWHQVPAASLPDDDAELAKLAGFGFVVREWKKHRDGALYGWVKCSDGRLYHPVVAEKANAAWASMHVQKHKTECARIKKHNQRNGTTIDFPTLEYFLSPEYVDPVPRDIRHLSPGTEVGCPPGNAIQQNRTEQKEKINPGGIGRAAAVPATLAHGEAPARATPAELSGAMRRHSIDAQPADPRLIAAAAGGLMPATIDAACAEAHAAKPGERIGVGYVLAIAERWGREASVPRQFGSPAGPRMNKQEALEARNREVAERVAREYVDAHD